MSIQNEREAMSRLDPLCSPKRNRAEQHSKVVFVVEQMLRFEAIRRGCQLKFGDTDIANQLLESRHDQSVAHPVPHLIESRLRSQISITPPRLSNSSSVCNRQKQIGMSRDSLVALRYFPRQIQSSHHQGFRGLRGLRGPRGLTTTLCLQSVARTVLSIYMRKNSFVLLKSLSCRDRT